MAKRLDRLARRAAPILAAGMLLQTGGCAIDLDELAMGLVTSIANSLISNLVFSAFNLV